MNAYPRAISLGLRACQVCGQVVRPASSEVRCLRCGSRVTARMPASAEKTLAWLIAGIILYFPANLLPVMHTSALGGGGQESTILGGILEFYAGGSWDIAALIFVASVAVPVTKFISLGLLLWTVRQHSAWAQQQRTALYRVVEFIGYWSMLDVVVVAITCSLLQFKGLATAEPRIGILFFCGVVVATMISALSFDPRLIWDSPPRSL